NAAVNKLREILGDSADNPRFIETLPRRGYRFIVPVDILGEGLDTPAAPVPTRFVPENPPADPADSGVSSPNLKSVVLASTPTGSPAAALDTVNHVEVPAHQGGSRVRSVKFWLSPIAVAAGLLLVFIGISKGVKNGAREASADLSSPASRLRPFTGPDEDAA